MGPEADDAKFDQQKGRRAIIRKKRKGVKISFVGGKETRSSNHVRTAKTPKGKGREVLLQRGGPDDASRARERGGKKSTARFPLEGSITISVASRGHPRVPRKGKGRGGGKKRPPSGKKEEKKVLFTGTTSPLRAWGEHTP